MQRTATGRALASVTARLIAMEPGGAITIKAGDRGLDVERKRMASRFRTARLVTGHRYRLVTTNGTLRVYCEAA